MPFLFHVFPPSIAAGIISEPLGWRWSFRVALETLNVPRMLPEWSGSFWDNIRLHQGSENLSLRPTGLPDLSGYTHRYRHLLRGLIIRDVQSVLLFFFFFSWDIWCSVCLDEVGSTSSMGTWKCSPLHRHWQLKRPNPGNKVRSYSLQFFFFSWEQGLSPVV